MNTLDTSYYSLFGIAPDTAGRILRAAISKGGDYADIFCEHTVTNELSLRDGEVKTRSAPTSTSVPASAYFPETGQDTPSPSP